VTALPGCEPRRRRRAPIRVINDRKETPVMAHELEHLVHHAAAKSDAVRATRALSGAGTELKTRAFDLLAVC
jgi:hypothetical protein